MSEIFDILEELDSDSKRTAKLGILKREVNNTLLKEVANFALNPYIRFYIKKIPTYAHTETKLTLQQALNELKKLSQRDVTGNAGIDHLRWILSSVDSNDAIVVSRIIKKDLRCGIAEATVNAIWEDIIPTHPCLLARPYDSKNIENIVYPAISQLKADGTRFNAIIEDGLVTTCGRSGKEMELFGILDAHFIDLRNQFGKDCVFDGELVVVDHNGKVLPRKTGNGIINKAIKGTISEDEAKRVRVELWDVIPIEDFNNRIYLETCRNRLSHVIKAISDATVDKHLSWVIPHRTVYNLEQAEAHFQEMLSDGKEGIILKNEAGIWEDSRSKDLVKMKAEKEADLEIIGWNKGSGKFEGLVGSLIFASSDRKVQVSVSGFPDDQRIWITENIDSLMWTIGKVIYNERISSEARGDVDSLFLPRLAELRKDKTVANSSLEIT